MNSVLITFVRCHLWAGEGQKLAFARNTAARVAALLECNAMYDSKSDRNDMEHIAGASAHSRPPLAGTCHRYECTLASTSGRATSPRDGGAGTPSCLLLHHTLAQIAEMLVFGLDAADRLGVDLALLPTLLPLIGDAGRRRTAGRPTGCICLRHGLVVCALAPGGRSADTLAEQLEGVALFRTLVVWLAWPWAIAMVNLVQPCLEVLEASLFLQECSRVPLGHDRSACRHGPSCVSKASFTNDRGVAPILRQCRTGSGAIMHAFLMNQGLELFET